MVFHTKRKIHSTFYPITPFKFVLLVATCLLMLFLITNPFLKQSTIQNASSILISFSQLLTTIFAITISVTLVGVTYLAQMYTPRSIRDYFKDKFFIGFISAYFITISLNLLVGISVMPFVNANDFITPSWFLIVFCLLYLIAYPFHIIRKVQPNEVMKEIEADIPKDLFNKITNVPTSSKYAKTTSFLVLEQAAIRSIRNNDYDMFIQCLNCINKTAYSLLVEATKEFKTKKDFTLLAERTDDIVSSLYRLLVQISVESYETKNVFFLVSFLKRLELLIRQLHSAKAIRALRSIYELHDDIGFFGLKSEILTITDEYYGSVNRLIDIELPLKYQEETDEFDKLTPSEQNKVIFDGMLFDYFDMHRLTSLEALLKLAVDKKFSFQVFSAFNIFTKIIGRATECEYEKTRYHLYVTIFSTLHVIYPDIAAKGFPELSTLLSYARYQIIGMGKRGLSEHERAVVTDNYCYFALISAKLDIMDSIKELGVFGRHLASGSESMATLVVLNTFQEIKNMTAELKNINAEEIKNQVRAIEKQNKTNNSKVTEKINKLLTDLG
jgi:hypothetical protein